MVDEPEKVDLESPDLAEQKRAAFEELFPGVLADGVLDTTRLGELLDTDVTAPTDGRERYGLMWAGKQEAVRSLLTPSRGSLTPDLENSVDFDAAEDVFIEGDNLEVLKLLQKAYNDKVKLIYIDPPYNTGNDFVYNDDFSDGLKSYLEYTGQVDEEGQRTSSSTDAAGRRHSKWLSMMYPRLVLARNLLTQDGAIFVSIDDNEAMNLKAMLDEVFGSENFIGQMVWAAGRKNDSKLISESHEYILVYGRNVPSLLESVGKWRTKKEGLEEIYAQYDRLRREHGGDHAAVAAALKAWFKALPEGNPSRRHRHYSSVDARGVYFPGDIAWPGRGPESAHFDVLHPDTGEVVKRPSQGWRFTKDRMSELLADGRVHFGPDESTVPKMKRYLRESDTEVPYSVFYTDGRGATNRLRQLLGGSYFENPKDESVLQEIIEFASDDGDIVMDFFAGSGSTAHAVALQNAADGKARRYVLVNLPEETDESSPAHKAGYETVSAITLARLHAVMESVDGAADSGLRVLSLDQSNFREVVEAEGELDLGESTLAWEESDWDAIAAEVLLKEGVALDQTWERHDLDDGQIVVSDGVAVVLTLELDDEVVKQALDLDPRVVVFLEDGFAGKDPVKGSAVASAKDLGITMKTV